MLAKVADAHEGRKGIILRFLTRSPSKPKNPGEKCRSPYKSGTWTHYMCVIYGIFIYKSYNKKVQISETN